MIVSTTSTSSPNLTLGSIPRFSESPLREFPQYVFENCNQGTCHTYTPLDIEDLKSKSTEITFQEWHHTLHSKTIASEAKIISYGEELDWFYGLGILEKELLPLEKNILRGLTIDSIIKYNGYFSRLANLNPGEFRYSPIRWAKYDFEEINETLILYALETQIYQQYPKEQAAALLRSFSASETQKNIYLIEKKTLETMITRLLDPSHPPLQFDSEETAAKFKRDWKLIHPRVVSQWIAQQGRTDDKLDIAQWLRERVHYFPVPSELENELQKSLESIALPDMHPIEKASKIWFDIVRIHISHEANKRTGKAIGSAILLSHGYLPPKIGPEDKDEYIALLKDGFEAADGHKKFTQFIARMIRKTHLEMAPKLKQNTLK